MTLRFLRLGAALTLLGAATACTGTLGGGAGDEGPDNGGGSGGSVSTGAGGSTQTPGKTGGKGATAAGGSTSSGSGGSDATAVELDLTGSPAYLRFVRLTNDQWANSTKDLLGVPDGATLSQNFQDAVPGMTDFINNELLLTVDSRAWSDFQSASEALADKVTASDAALAKVYTGTDAAGFIAKFGRKAYRRELTSAEKASYMTLFTSGSTLTGSRSTFAKGASLVIRAMLQSPYFLYRTELTDGGKPLSGYEIAAKLSLWLRNTTPSDALLDSAAGPGKLDTADGAAALAKTMLEEPAATSVMRAFHGQYLHFDRFNNLTKTGVSNYTTDLNPSLQEASYQFFDRIFSTGLGLKDVFTSTTGYVNADLAKLYGNGVKAPASGYGAVDLGAKRAGFFNQLPFLTLYAHNADPDSIHRGVSMNKDVLCSTLGPPAAVIPMLPARQPGQTNRQLVDMFTSGCGQQCHNEMINPMGFAFEHYDGMGQYRDKESHGSESLDIDASGSFAFIDGRKSYKDSSELMQLLSTEQQVHQCYVKKLASFGLQRDVIAKDMPLVSALANSSMASSGSVKQVIIDLVKQDAFRIHGGAQ